MAGRHGSAAALPVGGNFRWHYKTLFPDFNRHSSPLGRTKALLLAPRLMLERGHQFTERRSHRAKRRLIRPLNLRGFIGERAA
jgi:hypothetical protein